MSYFTPRAEYVKPRDGYWTTNFIYVDYPKAFSVDSYNMELDGIHEEINQYARDSSFISFVGYELSEFDAEYGVVYFNYTDEKHFTEIVEFMERFKDE